VGEPSEPILPVAPALPPRWIPSKDPTGGPRGNTRSATAPSANDTIGCVVLPPAVHVMVERGSVTRAVLGLERGQVDDRGLAGRICQACVDGLGIDGASISLLTASDARQTLCATDPVAELLEDLQFTFNEGPCMQAAVTGNPVLVPDPQHGSEAARWPIFTAAVTEQTLVRALFALPLQWGAVNMGVLDLYSAPTPPATVVTGWIMP
jgi:hypothetical protein